MAFLSIPISWLNVGKALKKELFQRISDNLEDHEVRINALSLGASPIEVFNFPILNASSAPSFTGLTYYRATSSFTLSTVQLEIFDKGGISSGIVSVDVKVSNGLGGVFNSVLTVQPSIDFSTASDYDIATGTLDPLYQSVAAGDVLRLDVTSLPIVTLGKFRILVYGNI
jgi:hypothetical protein